MARLRVYSAGLGLVVDSIAAAKDRIVGIAEDSGGYVESAFQATVVIRVPATRFDSVLAEIEAGGRVRDRTVRTSDVTERVGDLESRLRVARQTRDRLNELLQSTQDAEERVRVLAEIRRLTEQIDQMAIALSALQEQVALSRIAVQLISRIAQDTVSREQIPFPWIAHLEPLFATLAGAPEWTLDLGEEFAVFDGASFSAESADGTRVRLGKVANEPRQSLAFWTEALRTQLLRDGYTFLDQAELRSAIGTISVLRWSAPVGDSDWLCVTALGASGEHLVIAEAAGDVGEIGEYQAALRASLEALAPTSAISSPGS